MLVTLRARAPVGVGSLEQFATLATQGTSTTRHALSAQRPSTAATTQFLWFRTLATPHVRVPARRGLPEQLATLVVLAISRTPRVSSAQRPPTAAATQGLSRRTLATPHARAPARRGSLDRLATLVTLVTSLIRHVPNVR